MRTLVPGLLAAAVIASPKGALADRIHGTRSEKLVERAHWMALSLDRGHATAVVRRTVYNGGKRHDQAMMWLDMPEGAVAVDLRTLSMKDDKPIWYRAELMEAEAAAAKYRELTGVGGYYPKDPALLSWRNRSLLALQVFPVPPSQPKTIEYTLELPMRYDGGRYHITLPQMGTDKMPARVEVSAARAGDGVFVEGRRVPSGSGFALTRATTEITLAPTNAGTIEGALASVVFDKGRVLSHFAVTAAPKLSEAPRGAYVVVIVDASRSFEDDRRKSGLAAVRATLSHLRDAHVEVLTFDREVKSRLGGFQPVSIASRAIERLTIEPRNGSQIDDALARADEILAAAPSRAAKRVLVVTDLLTRGALDPAHVKALPKSGALMHIGMMRGTGDGALSRLDEHDWSKAARATGGLVWSAYATDDRGGAKEMAKRYEEWARPVRIHKLKIDAKGIGDALYSVPESLDEGQGFEDYRVGDHDVSEVGIRGELWSTPVRAKLSPDEGEAKIWSALAFGAPDILGSLSEPEMMVLAKRGHAVSPVTSLLAIEPGVRPSTEGLEEGVGEGGGGRGEGIGLGSIGTIGYGGGAPDHRLDFLRDALRRGLASCGGAGRGMTVDLETTRDEIVDVPRADIAGAPDAKLTRCVREAVWRVDLPDSFSASFQRWTLTI